VPVRFFLERVISTSDEAVSTTRRIRSSLSQSRGGDTVTLGAVEIVVARRKRSRGLAELEASAEDERAGRLVDMKDVIARLGTR
jgi:hypothetical protein